MVQIHVKQNDEHQLLYDCLCTSTIDAIARDIIKIHNLQLTIHYLVLQLENLCLYCPSLNPEPTDDDGKSNDVGTNKAWHSNATPTLQRALSEAKAYISKDQVLHRRPLSLLVLKDHIENIEREASASMISASHNWKQHPLPELKLLDEDTAELWWAGKKLMRDKRLSDYISNNEKTKIIVKLLPSDMCLPNCFQSAYPSNPIEAITLDQPKERKEKKYDSIEELLLNSSRANPPSLKSQFHGLPSIRYK